MQTLGKSPVNNPFLDTLVEMNGGQSIEDLDQELCRLIEGVRKTGKPGTLTYKVKVCPDGAGEVMKVLLIDDITVNVPKPTRERTYFFATKDNHLSRQNPNQLGLNLKFVKKDEAPLKEVQDNMAAKVVGQASPQQ